MDAKSGRSYRWSVQSSLLRKVRGVLSWRIARIFYYATKKAAISNVLVFCLLALKDYWLGPTFTSDLASRKLQFFRNDPGITLSIYYRQYEYNVTHWRDLEIDTRQQYRISLIQAFRAYCKTRNGLQNGLIPRTDRRWKYALISCRNDHFTHCPSTWTLPATTAQS